MPSPPNPVPHSVASWRLLFTGVGTGILAVAVNFGDAMPIALSLSSSERRRIKGLDLRIAEVAEEGVLGASPLVRVLWESAGAALKLFSDEAIYRNELEALRRLKGSRHVPSLLGQGEIEEQGMRLEKAADRGDLRRWIARDWVVVESSRRMPLRNPAAFPLQLKGFAEECSSSGLRMGDPKRANFAWDGERLVWLDFGWFYRARPQGARRDNEAFVKLLLGRLGW